MFTFNTFSSHTRGVFPCIGPALTVKKDKRSYIMPQRSKVGIVLVLIFCTSFRYTRA